MIVHDYFIQGSEQWFQARMGRPTASNAKKIITAAKGDYSATAKAYICELIGETYTPDFATFFGNDNTDRGNELEPEARKAFEEHTGLTVETVGFCTRDDGFAGCSPDGLIRGSDGNWIAGVEIKCTGTAMKVSSPMCGFQVKDLTPKKHVEWIMDGTVPDEHRAQIHWSMAITGLRYWHFWSYFRGLQPFHVVAQWDDYTDKVLAAMDRFQIEYGKARVAIIPKLSIGTQS